MSNLPRTFFAVGLSLISGFALLAQAPATPPQPTPENKKLTAFVGTWKDVADMKPSPFSPGGKIIMTETCEWFTGGFSLVCHTDTSGDLGVIKTLTLINYDPTQKLYTHYELNSLGAVDLTKGVVEGNTWTFSGEFEIIGKHIKIRYTINLPTPDSALMTSEASIDGGAWTTLMELKGTRVKDTVSSVNPTM